MKGSGSRFPCRAVPRWAPALWLGLLALVRPGHAGEAGFPLVTTFSATDLGTAAMSWSAVQEPDGELLFGCNALVGYDGERWEVTRMGRAYALRGLEFGSDGRLWAAANGEIGWFERTRPNPWTFHSLRPALPAADRTLGEVWRVFAEPGGAVFVTENKILRWDGRQFHAWPLPGAQRLIAMRLGDKIYVHHLATGLYRMGPQGPELVVPAAVLNGATIFWMEQLSDGWLLATSKGMFTFAGGRLDAIAPEVSAFVRQNLLTCALRLADGRLVLGTYLGGLAVMSPGGALDRVIDDRDGLPARASNSLLADREGGLWVTSPSHIFRVALASASTQFDRRAGLPAQPARKIVRFEGAIATATETGVLALDAAARQFRPVDSLRLPLWDLKVTPRGLLTSSRRDVQRWVDGTATVLHTAKKDLFVVQPSRLRPDSVLVSEGRDIVLLDAAGRARTLVHDLPDIAITIAEDDAGRLWLGTTTNGILLARPNPDAAVAAVPVTGEQGLPETERQGTLVGTPDGSVLAFSALGGWIERGASGRFGPIEGYPQRGLSAVSNPAADGSTWVVLSTTDRLPLCLGRVAIAGARARWEPRAVEGLWTIGIPQCIFAESGNAGATVLWIGGTDGILRTELPATAAAAPPLPPVLRAFLRRAGDDTAEPLADMAPYSTRAVLFEFAAPEFSRRPALRLETRLDGVDPEWVAAGGSSRREFTAVRDGHYVFEVRAVAETGMPSEPTVVKFAIAPPWWRTVPAIAGELLALGAILYGAYRLRARAWRRRHAELEAKVRERTDELSQASAAKTQFVANMSHDIRNPLNGIVGLTLALEDSPLDPRQRQVVATLRECTTYLSSLVDDVLDFASIEAGRVELRPAPFPPVELMQSVLATLQTDATARQATLRLESAPGLPAALVGDAGRIQQILINYGSNALKYAGGIVRFAVRPLPDAPDEIEFAVSDEGPGIAAAEQAGLFTRFNRLPGARQSEVTGTGLGLASCRLLADLMGGSVGVESHPGHGARFFLRLPLAVSTEPLAATAVPLPNATVLVVEDTDYNAVAAAAVLAKLGLTSERARTGQEALALFAQRRFNVVLLDRNLPDLDGTEVATRIRQLEGDVPQAILLAVTAYCTAEDRTRCLAAGMDAFVGKPLTPEKLRKVLLAGGGRLLTAASVLTPPEVPAPGIDFSLLDYISDGTAEGRAGQIDRFLAALAEAELHLNHAAAARDIAALADAAHAVLAQAKFVGASALERVAILLERTARARDDEAFAGPLRSLHQEIDAVTAAMARHTRAEPTT